MLQVFHADVAKIDLDVSMLQEVADVVFECCGISSACCMQHDLILQRNFFRCCMQHDLILWRDFFSIVLFECYSMFVLKNTLSFILNSVELHVWWWYIMYVQIRSRHVAVYVLKHALHTRDQRFDDDDDVVGELAS
jgi:hypothetical protein